MQSFSGSVPRDGHFNKIWAGQSTSPNHHSELETESILAGCTGALPARGTLFVANAWSGTVNEGIHFVSLADAFASVSSQTKTTVFLWPGKYAWPGTCPADVSIVAIGPRGSAAIDGILEWKPNGTVDEALSLTRVVLNGSQLLVDTTRKASATSCCFSMDDCTMPKLENDGASFLLRPSSYGEDAVLLTNCSCTSSGIVLSEGSLLRMVRCIVISGGGKNNAAMSIGVTQGCSVYLEGNLFEGDVNIRGPAISLCPNNVVSGKIAIEGGGDGDLRGSSFYRLKASNEPGDGSTVDRSVATVRWDNDNSGPGVNRVDIKPPFPEGALYTISTMQTGGVPTAVAFSGLMSDGFDASVSEEDCEFVFTLTRV